MGKRATIKPKQPNGRSTPIALSPATSSGPSAAGSSPSGISMKTVGSRPSNAPRQVRPVSVLGSVGEFKSYATSSPLRPSSVAGSRPLENTSNGGNVKVVVRARPFLDREVQKGAKAVIQMDSRNQSTIISPPQENSNNRRNNEPRTFYFDKSFWSVAEEDPHYANQETVYSEIGKEFLDHNFEGYNTCIFAYGQTGSGKTYTMMGGAGSEGIIPRTSQDLFDRVDNLINENTSCTVRISYFEVYNEQVRDLLAPADKKNIQRNLRVRESPTDGPYVEDLSEYIVKDAGSVLTYIARGNRARATASTKMNDQSSRSHAVVTLTLKQVHYQADTDATEEKSSQLRLVDLAGSERANSTGATGVRFREGSNINKSLSTLGRVIASLATPSHNRQLVPYRDSALTWILKESLGGNSRTAMVACISPADYDETLSTLRYADQAKRIKTRAVINQDIVSGADRDKLVLEMQDQIATLQHSLNSHHQQEEDQFKQELHKVRQAIKFYEDRSMAEEHKRKAVQAENLAVSRHNKMLIEHLREVTNKVTGNLSVSSGDSVDCYNSLKAEQASIAIDLAHLKQSVATSKSDLQARLSAIGTIY